MVNREHGQGDAADLNWAGMPPTSARRVTAIYAVNNPRARTAAGIPSASASTSTALSQPTMLSRVVGKLHHRGRLWRRYHLRPSLLLRGDRLLGNRLVLSLTPFGLAHSINCLGEGVAVLNPETGEDAVLDEAIRRAQVSPDRRRVLGIRDGELVVLDLETGERTAIPTSDEPDQVAWGAAGSGFVFYSTRVEQPEPLDLAADEAEALAATGLLPADAPLPRYGVSIHRVDLDTGDDLEVYAHDAWAVGRMIAAPDGRALLFSQIPNLDVSRRWPTARSTRRTRLRRSPGFPCGSTG